MEATVTIRSKSVGLGTTVRIRPAPRGAKIEHEDSASGGGSATPLLVGFPIPRKQVGDLAGGMIGKPGQDVSEPRLRIDVAHLAGLDKAIDGGGAVTAGI